MKFLIALALASITPAIAAVSPVRMDVQQRQKSDSKGSLRETKTQSRSLGITLQNNSRQQLDNLNVKYWFFTRSEKTGKASVYKHGERKVALAPGAREAVDSETVASTYTEEHVKIEKTNCAASGNNKGGKSGDNKKAKKVEGSGERIIGYGVRLYEGDKVLSETFSPQGMKDLLGK